MAKQFRAAQPDAREPHIRLKLRDGETVDNFICLFDTARAEIEPDKMAVKCSAYPSFAEVKASALHYGNRKTLADEIAVHQKRTRVLYQHLNRPELANDEESKDVLTLLRQDLSEHDTVVQSRAQSANTQGCVYCGAKEDERRTCAVLAEDINNHHVRTSVSCHVEFVDGTVIKPPSPAQL
ncbi:hypothetical protein RI367_008836 [Sorochytrium milnesiophthora]